MERDEINIEHHVTAVGVKCEKCNHITKAEPPKDEAACAAMAASLKCEKCGGGLMTENDARDMWKDLSNTKTHTDDMIAGLLDKLNGATKGRGGASNKRPDAMAKFMETLSDMNRSDGDEKSPAKRRWQRINKTVHFANQTFYMSVGAAGALALTNVLASYVYLDGPALSALAGVCVGVAVVALLVFGKGMMALKDMNPKIDVKLDE